LSPQGAPAAVRSATTGRRAPCSARLSTASKPTFRAQA
jgi:hypothetical protein